MASLFFLVHPNLVHESNPINPDGYWEEFQAFIENNHFDYTIVTILDINIPAGKWEPNKEDFMTWLESKRGPTFSIIYEKETAANLISNPEFKRVFIPFLKSDPYERNVFFGGGTRDNCLATTKEYIQDRFGQFGIVMHDVDLVIYDYPGKRLSLREVLGMEES